jgi:predicted RNase H-like HicB family nuclease
MQAETLEQAKELAKSAQREVLELIKRYEKRREQVAP